VELEAAGGAGTASARLLSDGVASATLLSDGVASATLSDVCCGCNNRGTGSIAVFCSRDRVGAGGGRAGDAGSDTVGAGWGCALGCNATEEDSALVLLFFLLFPLRPNNLEKNPAGSCLEGSLVSLMSWFGLLLVLDAAGAEEVDATGTAGWNVITGGAAGPIGTAIAVSTTVTGVAETIITGAVDGVSTGGRTGGGTGSGADGARIGIGIGIGAGVRVGAGGAGGREGMGTGTAEGLLGAMPVTGATLTYLWLALASWRRFRMSDEDGARTGRCWNRWT
jgi:hypothetical protein